MVINGILPMCKSLQFGIRMCLFFVSTSFTLNSALGQYQIDTAFQLNGASYAVFKVVIDSAVLKGTSIVDNSKRSPEDSLFPSGLQAETFAVTGCIVDPNCKPLGLHLSSGKTRKKLNLGTGSGNFYELTNGVVVFTERQSIIVNSRSYRQDSTHKWGLQSGPMLVDSSKVNPQLRKESTNRQIRVGVGVSEASGSQTLIFVRSKEPVNFHHLASLFLYSFNCKAALCLESGSFSSIRLPGVTKSGGRTEGSCVYISMRL